MKKNFLSLLGCLLLFACNTDVKKASEYVQQHVKSPSTYKMISCEKIDTEYKFGQMYEVEFDAQNGFGATIRDKMRVMVASGEAMDTWSYLEKYEPDALEKIEAQVDEEMNEFENDVLDAVEEKN